MSFNKKIYTCNICGRTDIGEGNFKHICPVNSNQKEVKVDKNNKNDFSLELPKKDIRINGC